MLSSLGARRDRSRSPSEGRPPSKVFIQDDETSVSLVPKIVVQEYSEETAPAAPSSRARSLTKEGVSGAKEAEPEPRQPEEQLEFTAQEHRQQAGRAEYREQAGPHGRAAVKLPLSPQELQRRKAKAAKNRPWLQKPAAGERQSPGSSQSSPAQPESGLQGLPQQKDRKPGQKEPKKKEREPQPVRQSGPAAESTQPPQKTKAQNQQAKAAAQTESRGPGASPEVASGPTASPGQPQTQVQTHVPAGPPLPPSSRGLAPEPVLAHAQVWARVRPSSPMQASLLGHGQPPVPSHSQLRSPAQSWAPVRPPSPKPPTQSQTAVQPETVTPPQGQRLDLFSQSHTHSMSLPQPFHPPWYFQGPSALQPWMPQQESQIQAMAQQGLPSSQGYPPQWPRFGPQVGAPGPCVDLPDTQPRMQTEALAQVIPWNSRNQQAQVEGSGLLHPQTHLDQDQQPAWVRPPSQHQMLLHPQRQQPAPVEQLPVQTRQVDSGESAQRPPQAEVQSAAQAVALETEPQAVTEPSFPSKPPAQVPSPPHKDQAQGPAKEDPSNRAEVQVGGAPSPPEYQSPTHQLQSPRQPKVVSAEPRSPSQPRVEGQRRVEPPSPSPPQAQGHAESPDLCVSPLTLSQAPPQAYTEAYAKAQALARNGFEEAKHCLQEHIRETISVFEDKSVSAEQASLKEVDLLFVHSSLCKTS